MESGIRSKLSPRLKSHIQHIDIERLSRLGAERVATKAIPNIGLIELVSGDDYARLYEGLYTSMFHSIERERPDLIVDRLDDDFEGRREGLAPYRVVGIRDHHGQAIGAAQFSVLRLPETELAVPYLQYIYVRAENRRQDMSEVLHTLVLAVASADAAVDGRTVPCTLFECEPPGYGGSEAARAKSIQRAQIHSKTGALALMLRRLTTNALRTPHVQPGLEPEDPPAIFTWAVRPSPAVDQCCDIRVVGKKLLNAYYQSLRDEGFPLANIALAEHLANQRCGGCEFALLPLMEVVPTANDYTPPSPLVLVQA